MVEKKKKEKIALFEVDSWEKTYLKNKLTNYDLIFFKDNINKVDLNLIKDVSILCVFVNSNISKKEINALPKLKLICTMSTGFDHIDVKYAKSKKISISYVPYYGENTVAEHTFALILSLSRNVHKAYMRTIQGNYKIDGLMGFDLKGKTLGLLGGGNIGMHVARMAKAFGMNVNVFDLRKDTFKEELIGFKYVEFDEILKKSDVISLHLPYNEHTHHIINKNAFKKMKKGIILINTARGGIIETESLLWALDNKIISGAGLDVLENEKDISEEKQVLVDPEREDRYKKLVQNHILLTKENVVYTPHIAFYSREALQRILDTTHENILSFETGVLKNNI